MATILQEVSGIPDLWKEWLALEGRGDQLLTLQTHFERFGFELFTGTVEDIQKHGYSVTGDKSEGGNFYMSVPVAIFVRKHEDQNEGMHSDTLTIFIRSRNSVPLEINLNYSKKSSVPHGSVHSAENLTLSLDQAFKVFSGNSAINHFKSWLFRAYSLVQSSSKSNHMIKAFEFKAVVEDLNGFPARAEREIAAARVRVIGLRLAA